jgi:GNAT superfamily N-acetyltransferase
MERPRSVARCVRHAGYVHRVAVGPIAHGHAVGSEMLPFAERKAHERGKRHLRLDCASASSGLRAYYASAGYGSRGEHEVHGATAKWCAALFEKTLI